MKKQILILLLAFFASISASAYDYDFRVNDIYYIISGKKASVTYGPIKYSGSVTIPKYVTYSGTTYSVYSIGPKAFDNCIDLTKVIIPESITSIGYHAFYHCPSLTSVTIPESVKSIASDAFLSCSGLEAFYGKYVSSDNRCLILDGTLNSFAPYGLTTYSIPTSVTSIGACAFSGCSSLTEITIPESVKSISQRAFSGCSSLTEITIPESVTSIGERAFHGCSSLEAVYGNYASSDNRCLIVDGTLNSFAPYGLTTYSIPTSVTSIGASAFSGCSSLTSVTINNSVTSIDYDAFLNCSGLTTIKVNNDNPANISLGSSVFYMVPTSTCILYVPKGSKSLYAAADQWSAFTNIEEYYLPVSLIDGEAYTATIDKDDIDVNYTRTFNNTEWQPLYVPFNMSYDEWSPYADVAQVANVRCIDEDGDEQVDNIVIEFNKLTSGEIMPNIPYVIRAKQTGEVTFECTGKNVLAAPAEEGFVDCSSTTLVFSFHGVYAQKTDLYQTGGYHLSGGQFHHAATENAVLPPYRFYLMVTPKNGGYGQSPMPQKIRMVVRGDDTPTSMQNIVDDTDTDAVYYDIIGRRIKNPTSGIFVRNGKKVLIK